MSEIINNALYLVSGMLIGLLLGWSLKTMQYAKEARDEARRVKRTLDEHGWYQHNVSLAIVLILTATAAVWTGIVNVRLQKNQQCTEHAITSIVDSLNERTSLSTDLALADSDQNKAFSRLMAAVLTNPQPPKPQMIKIFQDYVLKLNRYLALQDLQRDKQVKNPFPKNVNYHACLKGEK